MGCSEDGFSFSFDRVREDIEVRSAPHVERAAKFRLDLPRAVPNLRTTQQTPPRRRRSVQAAAWSALVGLVVLVRDRYVDWRDAPLRERSAQLEELAAIRAGALDHARYAAENGMPLSAAAWHAIAAEEHRAPEERPS